MTAAAGSTLPPRAVVLTRPTELEELVAAAGTQAQARFLLRSRGQPPEMFDELARRHELQAAAVHTVLAAIPTAWRRARASRESLDRFLFEPEDLVVAIGQDGLVANVAKYLSGQPVLGLNPLPDLYEGVLVRYAPARIGDAIFLHQRAALDVEPRTMVEARLGDGQRLVALNEVFVGHRSHQSARYSLFFAGLSERQSSSGLIVSTGTGATGWAKSVSHQLGCPEYLVEPTAARLSFFVREAWPSRTTGVTMTRGILDAANPLAITSEMQGGGTLFGDGLEDDRLDLPWGQTVRLAPAETPLNLACL